MQLLSASFILKLKELSVGKHFLMWSCMHYWISYRMKTVKKVKKTMKKKTKKMMNK